MVVLSTGRLHDPRCRSGPAGCVHAQFLLIALAALDVEGAHTEQRIFVPGIEHEWFDGVDLRLIGRDLFLNGNTRRESAGVDKDRYVGDLQMGVALSFERIRVAYTHVLKTREFRTREYRQNFGALLVSWLR
jgi:hypothetical protein